MFRVRLLVLATAVFLPVVVWRVSGDAPAVMVVANGDFEAQLDGWSFWSRGGTGNAESVAEGHGGKSAVRLRHDGARDWAFSNAAKFDVKPGQQLTVSAWVRGSGTAQLAVVALSGGKTLSWDIGSDAIKAGPNWERLEGEATVPETCDQIYVRFIGEGACDLTLDDVGLRAGGRLRIIKPKVNGYAKQRLREPLGRGLVALPVTGNKVYLSWRLFDNESADVAFNVYRQNGKTQPVRLNEQPVSRTTDFTDTAPPAGESRYLVRAVVRGKEGAPSDTMAATPSAEGRPYVSIKLAGDYKFEKFTVADLDGDGRTDYIVKQPNGNVDPYEQYWTRSPETYKIDAYRHDGTLLWRHDMGWAIERGIWYSPCVAYDFDGDGRAEVAVKSGEGDPRDADGKVTSGPEFISILDGRTGREITRTAWPSRDGFPSYNYFCRNQLGVAYLDGKTPCLIVERGTYNTQKIVAYEFHGGKLRELWNWNDREDNGFRGQGAHCLRAADVDGDGRDEVIYGSAVLDDNGNGLWSTRMGHCDHVTVGDLDPMRPGLEIQYGLEISQRKNGICMVDAATGKILWGLSEPTTHIHSSGLCADLDAAHPGVESYGGERDAKDKRWLFSAKGELIAMRDFGDLAPRAAYWDADPQRELLAGGRFHDFDVNLEPAKMAGLEPKIEGSVIAIADVVGDWREEVITSLPGEMRIYSTTIPATDRRVCLLLDPIYRLDVVGLSQGYWQVPSITHLPSSP